MSFDQLSVVLLMICGFALAIISLATIVGASLYDLRAAKAQRERLAHPGARRYRQRPLVTVLVRAQNAEASLKACLESLRRSSYRKLQIIVVDNASSDTTVAQAKAFIAAYPKLNIRLIAKRRRAPWAKAALSAYKSYGQGELVMTLNADGLVDKTALRRAVDHYNQQPSTDVVIPHQRPMTVTTLGGLLQAYLAFLAKRAHKAASVFGTTDTFNGENVCYRREAFRSQLSPAKQVFAADVVIHTPADQSYYRLCRQYYRSQLSRLQTLKKRRPANLLAAVLSLCGGLAALLVPLLISYFIFLAVGLHEPLFLMLSMAVLSVFLLFAVWEDEQLKFRQRLTYTLGIPVMYSLLYGLAWLKLFTACRALLPSRRYAT
ncbi:MAG TPA: glycosyltransferase family 2 protein [Candidatus Saccharimonadales bacterium]